MQYQHRHAKALSLLPHSRHDCTDLVLPGFVGVLFHFTWSGLIIVDAALIGLPDDCSQRRLATGSVLILLLSFVLTTCLQVWVTLVAARGGGVQRVSTTHVLLTAAMHICCKIPSFVGTWLTNSLSIHYLCTLTIHQQLFTPNCSAQFHAYDLCLQVLCWRSTSAGACHQRCIFSSLPTAWKQRL